MATASLVLGIISIMCSICLPGLQWCGIILSVIGMVLSGKNKEAEQASLAKAGKICCVIGLILCIILLVFYIICLNLIGSVVSTGFFTEAASILQELREYWFS